MLKGVKMKSQFTVFSFLKVSFLIAVIYCFVPAQTCPDGMISYWKFDEFGPVNMFLDSYGSINASCSSSSCAGEDTGIVNNARKFNGSEEIIVPDNNLYDWNENTSFTIEVWVKTVEPGTGNKVFIGRYQQGISKTSWWLGYGDNNKPIFSVKDSAGIKSEIEAKTLINDGQWHHIVGIRNDSINVLQIFVDGVEEGKLSTFFTGDFSGASPINIGFYVNDFYFTGSLDEVAIYNKKLEPAQVSAHYNNGLQHKGYCDQFTDVDASVSLPNKYALAQNYPNPFNPSTMIEYSIPKTSFVILKVYDLLGNEIASLINEEKPAGTYKIQFNTDNLSGKKKALSAGIYFYQLHAGNFVRTKKMILLK